MGGVDRLAAARRGLLLGEQAHKVAVLNNNIATILHAQGDLDGARSWLERALSILEETYGPDNPSTVTARKNLESL